MIAREPIVTERLRLEPVEEPLADAMWMATEPSLAELRRWLPWARHATLESIREFTRRSELGWGADTDYAFAVFEGSEVVGGIGLHTPRIERLGEVGYWVRSDRTRRGYAAEAGSALLAFAFRVVGCYRLELRAGVENLASCRVAEKLGFRREGTLRRGCPGGAEGGYDCHIYGLLADEYEAG